ncbi:LamG domain-containing protein [Salegentibacter sp. UBA1130]|uniref:LamG domain-containing protein n=1 Tax=Salegentibacter sp. UBA1130 TaxID=1947451 RepID=UPI0025806455|nr:LamG-like jellyroll fold domain-containing protein [Salegentibacter sp. UBA1130]
MMRFFILVAILWSVSSWGQNKHPDSLWLSKPESSDFPGDLQKGYNAFFIETLPEFQSNFNGLKPLFTSEKQILFIHDFKPKELQNISPDTLKISSNLFESSEEIKLFIVENKRFNNILYQPDSLTDLGLCKEFNRVNTDSLKSKKEIDFFLQDLLHTKGVVPDLIVSPYIADIGYLKEKYYKEPVYRAKVTYNNEELNNVSWKEFPHLETCGVFRTSDSTLSPQKRGFMFSPDIYNFTDKNTRISGPKTFRAIKYELGERLRYSLPLEDEINNLANRTDKSTPTDIDFVEDINREKSVSIFNGASSYIDIRNKPEEWLEEISISAWIKPDEVDGSFSLIGKGEAFSAKIYFGRLQFTTTGIKDHTTSKRVIKKGEWTQVAFVYVPKQKLYLYVNGSLVEEIAASDIRQTDHALLIGTNLWGQYYSGLMSDLKIWDRALSDDEIKSVYLEKTDDNHHSFLADNWLYLSGLFLILIIPAFFIFRKKPTAKQETPTLEDKALAPIHQNIKLNSINLLNGFKVWNLNGEDITSKFSPKRRELLILILLFTLKDSGITSKKLSDILWPGFPAQNKKNNRSTQIKELRKILEKQLESEILFDEKKWQLEIAENGKIDVFTLNKILPDFWSSEKEIHSEVQAIEFARIVSKGPLLPQVEVEWLDAIKAEYNSRVLDLLSPFLENEVLNSAEKIEVIEAILVVDPLFEPAVRKKVSCLLQQEKYGSAKKTVENYKKLYESYYNETIDPEFMKIVK